MCGIKLWKRNTSTYTHPTVRTFSICYCVLILSLLHLYILLIFHFVSLFDIFSICSHSTLAQYFPHHLNFFLKLMWERFFLLIEWKNFLSFFFSLILRIRWNFRITEKEQQTVSDVAFEVSLYIRCNLR